MSSSIQHRFRELADEVEKMARELGSGYESDLLFYVASRWHDLADEGGGKALDLAPGNGGRCYRP
jgi:hypothetical protein